jgi:hypothetical protein
MNDIDLIELVSRADPLANPDRWNAGLALQLTADDIVGHPQAIRPRPHRRAKGALLLMLLAGAVVGVPTAIAFHRQVLDVLFHQRTVPSPLSGRYTATLKGLQPASQDGQWTLSFVPLSQYGSIHGSYTRTHNGVVVATGGFDLSYGTNGANLFLRDLYGPAACSDNSAIGSEYTIHITNHTLTMQPVFDTCTARRRILATGTFTRR